jgi:Fe-S cluster biosynthesis and repair protein YggX
MDEQTDKGRQYTYGHSYAINIHTMEVDRQGQSIYLRWNKRQTRIINIPTMDEDKQGLSIYLQWTNRQTITINIPTLTMNEQTDKGDQYTYDGRTDRQG